MQIIYIVVGLRTIYKATTGVSVCVYFDIGENLWCPYLFRITADSLHQPRGVVALLLVSRSNTKRFWHVFSLFLFYLLVRPSQNSISCKNSLGKRPFKEKMVSLNEIIKTEEWGWGTVFFQLEQIDFKIMSVCSNSIHYSDSAMKKRKS